MYVYESNLLLSLVIIFGEFDAFILILKILNNVLNILAREKIVIHRYT